MPEFDLGAMLPGILQSIFEQKITSFIAMRPAPPMGAKSIDVLGDASTDKVISLLTHMIGSAPVAENVVIASSNLATLGERLLVVLSAEIKTGDCLVKSYDALACRLIKLADPRCACPGIPSLHQAQKHGGPVATMGVHSECAAR
jgi:hypothetical protein